MYLVVADVDSRVTMKVEREVIDKLDELVCEGRGDDEYKQLFTDTYVHAIVIVNVSVNVNQLFLVWLK